MIDNSKKRRARAMAVMAAAVATMTVAVAVAGCSTSSSTASQPPTFKLVKAPGNAEPTIVLTKLGATRIGLQTALVAGGQGGEATFPYAALLYESNGQAVVYVSTGALSFQRELVSVDTITGDTVTVTSGVTPGQKVATDGAEELLGVQNGVGEET
jgi:hypothetical protein